MSVNDFWGHRQWWWWWSLILLSTVLYGVWLTLNSWICSFCSRLLQGNSGKFECVRMSFKVKCRQSDQIIIRSDIKIFPQGNRMYSKSYNLRARRQSLWKSVVYSTTTIVKCLIWKDSMQNSTYRKIDSTKLAQNNGSKEICKSMATIIRWV